jgi:hypothetical protein
MQEPFDRKILGGARGHYARGHFDIIKVYMADNALTLAVSQATP